MVGEGRRDWQLGEIKTDKQREGKVKGEREWQNRDREWRGGERQQAQISSERDEAREAGDREGESGEQSDWG